MPPRSRERTWRGSGSSLSCACAAGTRLSRTSAVFPAPDGPASAVRRCSAKAAVTSCRLYRSPTSIVTWPPGPGRRAMVALHRGRARQERADDRARVGGQLSRGALGDDGPAVCPGGRAELDDPVRGGDQVPLVFHDDDGVAVRGQGGDRLAQPHDVARVQPHGRLVEHVEHAGRAGAHRGGQLDALPLPRRQGRAGPVQLQVAEPHVQQRAEPAAQLAGQARGKRSQFVRQPAGQGRRERPELVQPERADLGDVLAAQQRAQRLGAQPGPVADRAGRGRSGSAAPGPGCARCRCAAPARRWRWRSRRSR